MTLPFIKTDDDQYTVVIDNKPYTFDNNHHSFVGLTQCIQTDDVEDFKRLYDRGAEIDDFSHGHVRVENGILRYGNEQCDDYIAEMTLEMIRDGFDYVPMFNFIERLYNNPSHNSVTQLFPFMRNKGMPITNDGFIFAYKYASIHYGEDIKDVAGNIITAGDYVDSHTKKTHRYNPGDVAEMPRYKVCDDPHKACEAGLHVGTAIYAKSGTVSLIVAVDPADVVCVPKCETNKMRVCKFKVVSEYEKDFDKVVEKVEVDSK